MTEKQLAAITKHGRNLLAIFPNATERDPVKLCKKLRRLEAAGNVFGLRLCNGPPYSSEDAEQKEADDILAKVHTLFGVAPCRLPGAPQSPIFINRDPRGYAIKIRSSYAVNLVIEKDWGGYGIIAPEFNKEGN